MGRRQELPRKPAPVATLPFRAFWTWLQAHPNCIVRAGTPNAIIYDDDDLHWHFVSEPPDTEVVQVFRGKKLVAEMMLAPAVIAHVQVEPRDENEYGFALVTETGTEQTVAYHFVLSHGYAADEPVTPGRTVH